VEVGEGMGVAVGVSVAVGGSGVWVAVEANVGVTEIAAPGCDKRLRQPVSRMPSNIYNVTRGNASIG
jgi:hypothetical protein